VIIPYKILFICLGNICRSPSAQVIFASLLKADGLESSCQLDSAGTHDFNLGKPPDARARAVLQRHGLQMNHLRARQVTHDDCRTSDLLLAMDQQNLATLASRAPAAMTGKIHLLTRYASAVYQNQPVPDPYYGEARDFESMYEVLQDACQGLLEHLRTTVLVTAKGGTT